MNKQKAPAALNDWEGTRAELNMCVQHTLEELAEQYPKLTKKQITQLFCDAYSRNLVQNELLDMAAYIMEG